MWFVQYSDKKGQLWTEIRHAFKNEQAARSYAGLIEDSFPRDLARVVFREENGQALLRAS